MLSKKLLSNLKHVEVIEIPLCGKIKGLYADGVIAINKHMTNKEKICVLAHELGHHFTTYGNILDQSKVENRKQEHRACAWSYKELIPLRSFLEAHQKGIYTRYELAEFLEVTEEFLEKAIQYYKKKHGLYYEVDNYLIYFEPLAVLKKV